MTTRRSTDEVLAAVANALHACTRDDVTHHARGVVLAVSGGRDSMVLLDAAVRVASASVRAVATFDHGTGPHATAAVALVREVASTCGVPVVSATATSAGRTEADWREARWRFLNDAASDVGAAAIATAHTRDDQLETVAMRVLRGAGARGMAALAARSTTVVRPMLSVSRERVAEYAEAHDVCWTDDPSNADRRHLRVRLRADLLPAISRLAPQAAHGMLACAERAARWRDDTGAWVARARLAEQFAAAEARVLVSALAGYDAETLGVFWPAFAACAGVRLDRRAIARLAAWTSHVTDRVRDGTVQPARVTIAGGYVVLAYIRHADASERDWTFIVRAMTRGADVPPSPGRAIGAAAPDVSDYACSPRDPAPTLLRP